MSLAGALDLSSHQLIGEPLYLTAKSGTNITMEALNGGEIVMHSPLKMVGPIIPRDLEFLQSGDSTSGGGVPMVQVMGTVKVQNLQFKLLDSEMNRPDASPQPGMLCNYQSTGRHGWVRLTHSAVSTANADQKYHLYICTVNGWKPITSDSGAASGR